MGPEGGFVRKAFAALGTNERLLARVVSLVYHELRFTEERFVALGARIGLCTSVGCLM